MELCRVGDCGVHCPDPRYLGVSRRVSLPAAPSQVPVFLLWLTSRKELPCWWRIVSVLLTLTSEWSRRYHLVWIICRQTRPDYILLGVSNSSLIGATDSEGPTLGAGYLFHLQLLAGNPRSR